MIGKVGGKEYAWLTLPVRDQGEDKQEKDG